MGKPPFAIDSGTIAEAGIGNDTGAGAGAEIGMVAVLEAGIGIKAVVEAEIGIGAVVGIGARAGFEAEIGKEAKLCTGAGAETKLEAGRGANGGVGAAGRRSSVSGTDAFSAAAIFGGAVTGRTCQERGAWAARCNAALSASRRASASQADARGACGRESDAEEASGTSTGAVAASRASETSSPRKVGIRGGARLLAPRTGRNDDTVTVPDADDDGGFSCLRKGVWGCNERELLLLSLDAPEGSVWRKGARRNPFPVVSKGTLPKLPASRCV